MRKLYSFVLLGLLASTNPIFAMDLNDGTDADVEIDKFSAASPTNMAVTSSKVVPEGSDVPWYDDEVASGSPSTRGRAKSMDKGGKDWEEGEGLLEELAARSSEATKDPLTSSVVISAANQGRFSPSILALIGDEEKEGNLPKAVALGRQTSAIGEETIEGETPTAVAAPMVTYFESVPDRETAETVLTSLRKNLDVVIHMQTVVHYLYHPSIGSRPADGFDLNVFANQLSTCKTADEQSAVLSAVERTYVEKAFTQLIIDQDADTVNQLKLVMNYVYDPDNAEKRAEGFDVINFESELSGCETLAEQQELLNQMENEYEEAWESGEDETLAAGSVPETTVYFESTDDNDRARAEEVLSRLVPSSDSAIEHLQNTLNLLYQSSTLPSVETLNKIARELDELISDNAKEGYLITLQEELSGDSQGSQSATE